MKRPSSAKLLRRYLLLLFTIYNPVTAFVPVPAKSYSSVIAKNALPAKGLPLPRPLAVPPLMAFKPLAFLNDNMKFAGPIATLGLTLPQLHDHSMKSIQRVGETSFAAMLAIAAIQGALVSRQEAYIRIALFPQQAPSHLSSFRSCINTGPTQPVN